MCGLPRSPRRSRARQGQSGTRSAGNLTTAAQACCRKQPGTRSGSPAAPASIMLMMRTSRPIRSRVVLIAGFGGLLLLVAFAGFDGIQALSQIRASNDRIREDFLLRTRLLERIRSDLYVSGTYVRDYLLEPEAGKAEGHRYSLLETKQDMDQALGQYRRLLTPEEKDTFERLTRELANYWNVLQPVFQWTAEKRQRDGFPFLRDEVFPRRMTMLGIADQIRDVDESQLNAGKLRMLETFAGFRQRLILTV